MKQECEQMDYKVNPFKLLYDGSCSSSTVG